MSIIDPTRQLKQRPDLAGKKVCKTCDFCNKPTMFNHTTWQCQAPQNAEPILDMVSGDWKYMFLTCREAMDSMDGDCSWWQIDPYIPINGVRHVDQVRALEHSTSRITNADLKKLTLDDIL